MGGQAELDDQESLMPHSHTILGLKVADAEEALTVRRVGTAVLGLMVVLVIHFIVHVAHDGNVIHALGHLAFSAALPGVGYVAVSQRSTKATWAFHMVAVLSAVIHGALLLAVLRHYASRAGPSGGCAVLQDVTPVCRGIRRSGARDLQR